MRPVWRASLSPAGSVVGSGLTMLILVLAARQGQLASIAGYGAGVSVGAITAVLVGGGTTLAFVSGDAVTQQAVRNVRILAVGPLMIAVVLLASLAYVRITGLSGTDVLMGGAAAFFNNLSELEGGYLKRRLRTPTVLAADLSSRVLGVVVVVSGLNFAVAMTAAAVARFSVYVVAARDDPSRVGVLRLGFRVAVRRAYNRNLMGLSVFYALSDRQAFLVVPVVSTVAVAGAFSTLLSSQQAVAAVLVTGLQTTLAVRSEAQGDAAWITRFESAILGGAFAASALGVIFQSEVFGLLGIVETGVAQATWTMMSLSLPIAVSNRAVHFRLIARRRSRRALLMLSTTLLIIVLFSVVSLLKQESWILAAGLLFGEMGASIGWVLLPRLVDWWRARTGMLKSRARSKVSRRTCLKNAIKR